MIDHRRAFRRLRVAAALICTVLLAAACNLGAPQAQTLPTATGESLATAQATRTLIPGVPTSRVVTTTPIPFPTRVVQAYPTAVYVPPQTNPQPTAQPLPYSIVIISPLPGNVIAGNVAVLGSASHPQFLQYRLEFGPDPNPNNLWFPITGVVQTALVNGTLGVWNTTTGGSPDGYYQIRLRVILRDGSQQTTTVNNIRVQNQQPTPVPTSTPQTAAPIAAFTQDYTSGIAPLVVRFFNQSQGNITSYLWNFGDGNLSSALNPIESFTKPGVYNVSLTVTGPGGSANVTRQINVTSPGAPTASFIPNTLSGPLDTKTKSLEVSFTNRSTGNITSYDWDFGDGSTSKEVNPKHAFKAVGSYNVILKATGPGGSNTAVRQITVSNPQIPAPVADFVPGATSGQIPLSITFVGKSTGQITSYLWDFDGNNLTDSTDKDPTFTYTVAGKFNVKLTVLGPGGQSSKTVQIEAKAPPNAPAANFTANPVSGTAPLKVDFTNTTTGTATGYEWDFESDGKTDVTTQNASFTYTNPGTYTVRLKATGAGGTTQKELNISVSAPIPAAPVAKFTANPTSGQSPLTVTFTNESTGQIDSFAWDFNGDGKADNTVDGTVQFIYSAPGTYAATLTVSNTGGSDTEQVTITVTAPPGAPTASFTAAPESGDAPLNVTFTNTSTGTVDKVEWDFNSDGTIDSTATSPVQFSYTTPGTYTAKLTVSNSGGSASAIKTIEVKTPLPAAPVASFTADPTTGNAPLTVTFTNTSTGTVDSLAWDFNGDGTVDNTADSTASFTFDKPGTYNATLTVSNAGGSNKATVAITVGTPSVAAPTADFTANPTTGVAPLTVTFTNTSTGTVDSLSWDFNGDGTADNTTDSTASFTFSTEGAYDAALTVTNAGGSSTKIITITVGAAAPGAPTASFTANPTSGSAPLTVTFSSTSSGQVDSAAWDFNSDGVVDSNAASATFTYNTAGTYNVTLTVTNAGGSNSTSQTITVNTAVPSAPVAAFSANPTSGSAPLTVTFTNNTTGTVDSVSWDFNGDGTADSTSNGVVTFTYNAAGTYNASLTVTNAGGSNSTTQAITVSAALPNAPVASFTANPTSGNAPLTVTFNNTTAGQVDSVSWDFNGDNAADDTSSTSPSFTYQSAGSYTVSLTVTNAGGSNTAQQVITVGTAAPAAPVASFTANPNSGNAPLIVTFNNTSSGQVDSIIWDFNGDGVQDNMTDMSPTFTYNTAGTYTVSMTVNNAGGSNTAQQVITVGTAAPAAPVASFTTSANTINEGESVTFTNTTAGPIDTLSWDLNGDGTPDNTTDNTVTFPYPTQGSYNASLTVTNAGGSNTLLQTITVNAAAVPVTASFTADQVNVPEGTTVNFTSTSSGPIDTLSWDFTNDGTADATGQTASFLFATEGTYTVTLTAAGAGQSSTTNQVITVTKPASTIPQGQIVYISNNEIYLSDANGSGVQQLTSDGSTNQGLSVNGDKVVFASNRDPNGGQDLYLLDLNSLQVTPLTEDDIDDSDPVWSNDGSKIAYVSTAADGTSDIWVVNADGSGQTQITTDASNESQPSWSQDGTKIVFVSNRDNGDGTSDNEIYIMDANGGNPQPLTNNSDDDREPVWAPDGSFIAYTSNAGGSDNIWVMNPDGSNAKQVTTDGGSQPSWADGSNYILYLNGGNLFIIKPDGSDKQQLTTNGAQTTGQWR